MRYFIFFLLLTFHVSCSRNIDEGIDNLIDEYSLRREDSLKLQAAQYLKRQIHSQTSERNIMINTETGNEVFIPIDSIKGAKELNWILEKEHLSVRQVRLKDDTILTKEMLNTHIRSFDFFLKTWPWNFHIDKKILFNYLLAYKIYDEEPQDWRTALFKENQFLFSKILASYKFGTDKPENNPTAIAQKLLNVSDNWYNYQDDGYKKFGALSFNMMKCVRKGDCYFGGYIGVYTLRSFGIPAALDYCPLWGSKNGGHAEVAALDSNGKIGPIPGHELNHASKVYRFSFEATNLWTGSISRLVEPGSFLLSFLKHDHWLDVTSQHSSAADINLSLPENSLEKFAYICIYNYGKWQPVFFGEITQRNQVCFKNMGKDILYHVALPDQSGFRLIGQPFLFDTLGHKIYFSPDKKNRQEIHLSKLNSGTKSWVKKEKIYSLYFLDSTGKWEKLNTVTCTKDSMIAPMKVPGNAIFRLVENNQNSKLERPFTYSNHKQIWH